MATIGIIGGMSWYSTINYYRIINQVVQQQRGGHHSARILIESLDFDTVRALQLAEDWDGAGRLLAGAARRLEAAGADTVLIGTNLMHKVAPAVQAAIGVPLLHIADAVGAEAARRGHRTLAVLGTKWVMSENFYAERLAAHGISAIAPAPEHRGRIDQIIFDELTQGVITDASRSFFVEQIEALKAAGADAVVLACTEIELLICSDDSPLPVIDSMATHALAAAQVCLSDTLVSA